MTAYNVTSVDPSSPISGVGALTATAYPIPLNLAYFQCVGYYGDVENPFLSGSSNIPLFTVITGTVTFYPRVPVGTVIYLEDLSLTEWYDGYAYQDTAVALAPIVARVLSGQLQTIDVGDTPGVGLLANTPAISYALEQAGVPNGELIYDIKFSNVKYADSAQVISNFAIIAPTSSTTISLTDPALQRLKYAGP